MAKKIKELTLKNMGQMAGKEHGEYLDNQLLMVMSAMQFGKSFMRSRQPYRLEDGRVLRIISGTSQFIINMKPYYLSTGMMVVMPAGSVMELVEKDDDFDFQIFSFRELPDDITFKEDTVIHLSDDDWMLMGEYYQLLKHTVSRQPLSMKSVRAIQTALMSELQSLKKKETNETSRKASGRKEVIFHHFVTLVNQHADKEHNIAFYANKLCLTPNHLGSTIRKASGMTVQDWIHRRLIQQSKLLLMYSDLPISEIAEQLSFSTPSAFCKFFKKETQMTPGEYREGTDAQQPGVVVGQ
ncbi:MAG: helix-turn-helix transcriptional regulator [Bacteroidales bacterium]|nr:helix-turn-helix transcriptional regulator [Bacteroidales bacterium]